MIQLQVNIHLPPDGMGCVELNRLTREDVNNDEATVAAAFEAQYVEMVKFICDELKAHEMNVTYTEIGAKPNDRTA